MSPILVRRLDANHDMTFGRGLANFASGQEAVIQNVSTRLLTLLGEWFLDTSAGVPYLQSIDVKSANVPYIESLLKQAILDTDGVVSITSFTFTQNSSTRRAQVTAGVTTLYNSNEEIIQVGA